MLKLARNVISEKSFRLGVGVEAQGQSAHGARADDAAQMGFVFVGRHCDASQRLTRSGSAIPRLRDRPRTAALTLRHPWTRVQGAYERACAGVAGDGIAANAR